MRTTITPDMAKEFLKNNDGNRSISKADVLFLKNEILNNRFLYNGATVVIGKSGRLLDGQHRLMACVEANKNIEVELIEGVEDEAFHTLDVGKKRTDADIFSISGVENNSVISSAVNLIIDKFNLGGNYKKGDRGGIKVKVPVQKKIEFYSDNMHEIDKCLEILTPAQKKYKFIPLSHAVAMAFLLNKTAGDYRGLYFMRQFFLGVMETDCNAPIALRDRFIKNSMARIDAKLTAYQKRSLFIKTFNNYLQGKDIKRLSPKHYESDRFF